jgi:hypothetical protein
MFHPAAYKCQCIDTLARIRGWMEHDYAGRVAEFGKAWKGFAAQKGFWR